MPTFIPWCRIELRELDVIMNRLPVHVINLVVDLHYRRLIAATVTIIGSREDRHDHPIVLPLIALHDELMRAGYEVKVVDVRELFGNVLSEGVSGSPWGDSPSASVIGIRPDEVTHGSLMGNLLDTIEIPRMVKGVDAGAQSSVEAEDTIRHDGRHGEVVEGVREVLPDVGIAVFSKALIVKSIYLRNLATLVIAPENGNTVPMTDLEGDEQRDGFQRIISPIDVVAHEQIVRLRTRASDAEEFGEVVELSVDVAADRYRSVDGLDVRFVLQDFFRLVT